MSVRQQLNALEFSGLIRIAQVEPEIEYLFRHALVQDAAYESLLRSDRKALHLLVGEALESLYSDRCEDLAAVLGNHFYLAGDPRSLNYFITAGDVAFQRNANAEAVTHYSHAWEVAQWEDVSASTEQLSHLCRRLGRALQLTDRWADSPPLYDQIVALAQERSDRALELAAQIEHATILSANPQGSERGTALSLQTLAMARELGDRHAEAKSLWNLMLPERFSGNVSTAIDYGEKALTIARALDQQELMAFVINDLAFAYTMSGDSGKAHDATLEARTLWKELGNLPMLSDNLSGSSVGLYFAGEFEKAIAQSEEAYQISLSIDHDWGQAFSDLVLDLSYLEAGQCDKALDTNQRTQSALMRLGAGFVLHSNNKQMSRAYTMGVLGAHKAGLDLARSAFDSMTEGNYRAPFNFLHFLIHLQIFNGNFSEAEALIQEGQEHLKGGLSIANSWLASELPKAAASYALAIQDYPRALVFIEQAEMDARRMGLNSISPQIYYLKGKVLAEMRNVEAACDTLQAGRQQADAGGGRFALWKILALLGQLEAESDHAAEAEDYNRKAYTILLKIIDHIDRADLRQSFMALPEVQAVLDTAI